MTATQLSTTRFPFVIRVWPCLGLGEALALKFTGQKLMLRELKESTTSDFLMAGKQKVKLGVD